MRKHSLVLGGAVLVLAIGLSGRSGAANPDKKVTGNISKATGLLEKKDADGAAKVLAEIPKTAGLDDVMSVFKLRKSGGFGVGAKPIANVADGIESLIGNLEKRVPAKALDEANDDLARAAYVSAVVAELIKDRCPVKKKTGNQDPADWKKWSEDMHKSSLELAEAIKAKKPTDVKKAAKNLNNSCLACHSPFKP